MGIPRVPCICGGRADLCLPGYAVRPFSGPLGFLQEHQTYQIPSPYFTVPFHTCLDDFLLAPSRESLVVQTSYILSLLQQLGLRVHLTKSQLAPSQMVEYLSSSPLGHSSDHPPRPRSPRSCRLAGTLFAVADVPGATWSAWWVSSVSPPITYLWVG